MTNLDKTCLAAVDADKDELMLSSSGGAFSVLARKVISHGGTVYGHAFDEGLHVACVRVDNLDGIAALRGSKYVQSDMGDSMSLVRDDLKAGRDVLFSGTPCQVDGLLAFLGGPQDRLLTVDIVCHGVPSQPFFSDCLKWEFAGSRLDSVRFRDKREGWGCGGGTTTTTTTPVFHRLVTRERPFSQRFRSITGVFFLVTFIARAVTGALMPAVNVLGTLPSVISGGLTLTLLVLIPVTEFPSLSPILKRP